MSVTVTTSRIDRRYLGRKTKAELVDLIMQMLGIGEGQSTRSAKVLVKAFLELNTIRARDGAPQGVCPEYFSSVIDEIDEVVKELTGKSAHCHPLLYKKD